MHRTLSLALAALASTTPGLLLAAGEDADFVPPAVQADTCKQLGFDVTGIRLPSHADLSVRVDESGVPTDAQVRTPTGNRALDAALISMALSCRYMPAVSRTKPAIGVTRVVFPLARNMDQRPGTSPAIANVAECAPTAEDYPTLSRQQNQTGTTRILFTIDSKGRLSAFGVARTSGHLLLDFTALAKLTECKFTPGKTADGVPIGGSFTVDYVWSLE